MKKIIRRIKHKVKIRINKIKRTISLIKSKFNGPENILQNIKYILKTPKRFIFRLKNSDNRFLFVLRFLLSSKLIVLILIAILMIKTMFFYQNVDLGAQVTEFTKSISLFFILILTCPLLFIKKDKNKFRATIIYDIVLSILLFADNVYWEYSVNMLSFSQIFYVQYAEEIGGTLPYLLDFTHFLYFIDIPILLVLWYISRKPLKKKKTKFVKNRGKRRLILSAIYTICVIASTLEPINVCIEPMIESPYLKLRQVGIGSIYGYHYLDIYNMINIKETTKYKTYDQMIAKNEELSLYKSNNFIEEDLYGIAENKNVIIIQLESVQNFVVNRTINGTEITPNLNKFINENIDISNMIVQSYSTTADSEYSVLTSLYPLDNGQAFSQYYASINNDIFKAYKNAGYQTSYMHGNVGEFWNRQNVYKRLDVDDLSLIDKFEDTSEIINGYLSDELLYKQAIKNITSYEEPFFSFIVAASSHTPYLLEGIEDKYSKVSVDVGESLGRPFGNYLEAVNYADYAFGLFIDDLKANGLYDDSMIIVFGDHYGMGMDEWEVEAFIKEINPEYNDITKRYNYVHLLCGMKVPGIEESVKISKPVSKVDIKPTLLALSGVEDNFSLGMNFFSTKDYAYISNGEIVTDEFYYYANKWYYINSGEIVDLDNLDEKTKKKLIEYAENVQTELDISRSILINNLLA